LLGTFLLWFGWYGFNCGSALIVDNEKAAEVVSLIAVNTTLGGAAGCVSALFLSVFVSERTTGEYVFDVIYAMNGTLTGLVSITAGCAVVEPWAAVFIGFVGGILHTVSSKLLVRYGISTLFKYVSCNVFYAHRLITIKMFL
jgi:Amt family ammonium transporter